MVRFEVRDTGIGIDPSSLERMFEPFMQADVSMTRDYGGNGLGLAISKELVERMGGTIGADSQPGRGSTFWFELGLPKPRAGAARTQTDAAAVRRRIRSLATADGPLVLLAEDNPVNRDIAMRVLERGGFRVRSVDDGREALDALDAESLRGGSDRLPDAGDRRLRGHAGVAPPRRRRPAHAGDRDDRTRDGRRPRTLPATRAWTTT